MSASNCQVTYGHSFLIGSISVFGGSRTGRSKIAQVLRSSSRRDDSKIAQAFNFKPGKALKGNPQSPEGTAESADIRLEQKMECALLSSCCSCGRNVKIFCTLSASYYYHRRAPGTDALRYFGRFEVGSSDNMHSCTL